MHEALEATAALVTLDRGDPKALEVCRVNGLDQRNVWRSRGIEESDDEKVYSIQFKINLELKFS